MNEPLFFTDHLVADKRILPLLALLAAVLLLLPGPGMRSAGAAPASWLAHRLPKSNFSASPSCTVSCAAV